MITESASNLLFRHLNLLDSGTLELMTPDGKVRHFAGKNDGENAQIEIYDWSVITNILRKGDIGFAEDYRYGKWNTNDLTSLIKLGLTNRLALERLISGHRFSWVLSMLSYLFRLNTIRGSKKNIHAHYDLGNEFYKLWLDPSMTYSSAIFTSGDESLEQAQYNKYNSILDLLGNQSGRLLEIGCGWGGFAEHAQNSGDFNIKALTLSDQQHAYAQTRLRTKAEIALEDYRLQDGKYDNIVSIEMFEAVGMRYWPTYFGKLASLLSKNGRAVIQTITMNDRDFAHYRRTGDFIRSHIFPGGMLPSPTRFQTEATKSGLKLGNIKCFGQDYAKTLQHWLTAFDSKYNEVRSLGFDDGFIRLWRFYLSACIAGFSTGHTDVMQVELSHAL